MQRRGRFGRPASAGAQEQDAPSERDKPDDARASAFEDAARLLNQRLRSEAELAGRLAEKGHSPEVVGEVLERLRAVGYLDDAHFAAAYIRDGRRLKGRGRWRLARELRELGVAAELIEEVLEAEYPAADEAEVGEELAERRAERLRSEPRDAARRRLAAFLEWRGLAPDVVRALIDRHLPWDESDRVPDGENEPEQSA